MSRKRQFSTDEIVPQVHHALELIKQNKLDKAEEILVDIVGEYDSGEAAELAAGLLTRVDSNNVIYMSNYGTVLLNNGKFPDAAQVFATAIEIDPEYGPAWNDYANTAMKIGYLKKAEEFYKKAYDLVPNDQKVVVGINRLNALIKLDDFEKAKEVADRYYKTHKNNYSLLCIMANIAAYFDDDEQMNKFFDMALKVKPMGLVPRYVRGKYGCLAGDEEMALKNWKQIFELEGKTSLLSELSSGEVRTARGFIKVCENSYKDDPLVYRSRSLSECLKEDIDGFEVVKSFNKKEHLIKCNGVTIYPEMWYLFKDKSIYSDLLFHKNNEDPDIVEAIGYSKVLLKDRDVEMVEVDETCVFLGGCENYYHWVFDYLPRLNILMQDERLAELPVVMNADVKGYQKDSLKLLGFDLNRVIPIEKFKYHRFREIYIPHLDNREFDKIKYFSNGMIPTIDEQSVGWLREAFKDYLEPREGDPKRIFLSRANAEYRTCINEDEVFELAKEYGFEKIQNENYSFADQIRLYAGAEAVMGVHGAGFTNMVFSPSSAKVIEMVSRDQLPDFFSMLAEVRGQEHNEIPGNITYMRLLMGKSFWDFEVDVNDAKDVLDKMKL